MTNLVRKWRRTLVDGWRSVSQALSPARGIRRPTVPVTRGQSQPGGETGTGGVATTTLSDTDSDLHAGGSVHGATGEPDYTLDLYNPDTLRLMNAGSSFW